MKWNDVLQYFFFINNKKYLFQKFHKKFNLILLRVKKGTKISNCCKNNKSIKKKKVVNCSKVIIITKYQDLAIYAYGLKTDPLF